LVPKITGEKGCVTYQSLQLVFSLHSMQQFQLDLNSVTIISNLSNNNSFNNTKVLPAKSPLREWWRSSFAPISNLLNPLPIKQDLRTQPKKSKTQKEPKPPNPLLQLPNKRKKDTKKVVEESKPSLSQLPNKKKRKVTTEKPKSKKKNIIIQAKKKELISPDTTSTLPFYHKTNTQKMTS
jgi:hypothetical protein